jgi:hypothetical protein
MSIPTRFVPRVRYLNQGAPPANSAPNVIPQRLQPIFISDTEMQRRTPVAMSRMIQQGMMGTTFGLTVPSFSLNYLNFNQQWQSSIRPGTRMQQWVFQGGDVYLDLEIGVYVDQSVSRARLRDRMLRMIMPHELLHVRDAIEIITQIMPTRLLAHPVVRDNLVNPQPMDEGSFQSMIRGDGLANVVRDQIFTPEWNSQVLRLDSGASYGTYAVDLNSLLQGDVPRR